MSTAGGAGRRRACVWLYASTTPGGQTCAECHTQALHLRLPAWRLVSLAICTSSPHMCSQARKYGVRSAMPGFIARKLCPHLVFVKTDFTKYTAASEETRAIFRCYDPVFEAGSLDEAYLDVTDYCREQGVTGAQVGVGGLHMGVLVLLDAWRHPGGQHM